MTKPLYFIQLVCMLLYMPNFSYGAGKGIIQGIIKDGEENIPMVGASVLIIGTSLGAASDFSGSYRITSVPEGTYSLIISFVSYKTDTIKDVKVIGGQVTTVNHSLVSDAKMLGDVVVRAERTLNQSTELSLVSELKSSPMNITGISNQQITRSMDFDAAQIAKRITGVTIMNNFVNIRGMNERYTLTYLNGMIAPSTESSSRAFSFDMLPSGVIDRMMVYRTPSPEISGDFGGGVVKVYTKNTTPERVLQLSMSTQFRPQSSFLNYYTYAGGNTDWLGYDDGTRAMPDGVPPLGEYPGANNLQENIEVAGKFKNNWNLQNRYITLDKRLTLNYFDRWDLGFLRINNLTSISYSQSNTSIEADFDQHFISPGNRNLVKDTIHTMRARPSVLQNLTFEINENHSIEFRNLFTVNGSDQTVVREGNSDDEARDGYVAEYIYNYRSRQLFSSQLYGTHKIKKDNPHQINWGFGYSKTNEDIPDQRLFFTRLNEDENSEQFGNRTLYVNQAQPNLVFANNAQSRSYYFSEEDNYIATLDYEKKFANGFFIRAGGMAEKKEKLFNSRSFAIGIADRSKFQETELWKQIGSFKDPQYHMDVLSSSIHYKTDSSGYFLKEDYYFSNAYSASNDYYAGYLGINIPLFFKKLNIYGGVRYEDNNLTVNTVLGRRIAGPEGGKDTIFVNQHTSYYLPSVNATWEFNAKLTARASYGKSLNRPQFREISPAMYSDFVAKVNVNGDSSLVNAEIHNFDAKLDYYPTLSELVSFGVFYKRFFNAIEAVLDEEDAGFAILSYKNSREANIYGAELEIRKNLAFIPRRVFQNLSVIANAAIVKTEVDIRADSSQLQINKSLIDVTRPLQGTVPYIINASLYYDDPDKGTSVTAIYNIMGQRLVAVASATIPDLYDTPRHQLDLTVRQRITKWVEISLGVQDILNQPYKFYRDGDKSQTFNPNTKLKVEAVRKDRIENQFRMGSYYSLGLNFTL